MYFFSEIENINEDFFKEFNEEKKDIIKDVKVLLNRVSKIYKYYFPISKYSLKLINLILISLNTFIKAQN